MNLITIQYCSEFCHTLTWISHGFTCVPHPETPSHLLPHSISLVHPSGPVFELPVFVQAGFIKGRGTREQIGNIFQFSSVSQSCPTLSNPINCSTPGLRVHHQLPEFTQTHVHRLGDAIQPSHPLLSPSPPAPNLSQHQSLFQWVNSSREAAKVLEFQLQHQSFLWTPRTNLL